jgi:predicted hydrolase (HD superfamily)
MGDTIGITDNRMDHTIAVARKCYDLARQEYGMSEENSRKAFIMGFLHDIGYEFATEASAHPDIAVDILTSFTSIEWDQMIFAIMTHGKPQKFLGTTYQAILNEADLTVNSKGEPVSMEERCEGIKARYGQESIQYCNSVKMIEKIRDFKIDK